MHNFNSPLCCGYWTHNTCTTPPPYIQQKNILLINSIYVTVPFSAPQMLSFSCLIRILRPKKIKILRYISIPRGIPGCPPPLLHLINHYDDLFPDLSISFSLLTPRCTVLITIVLIIITVFILGKKKNKKTEQNKNLDNFWLIGNLLHS